MKRPVENATNDSTGLTPTLRRSVRAVTQPISVPEVWRDVPGYEGIYEVSDMGQVRSLDRRVNAAYGAERSIKGRTLRGKLDRDGYRMVELCRDGGHETAKVHRLVLLAFVGPCPDGFVACHYDDDPANNALSNLRWGSYKSNAADLRRNSGHPNSRKTHCPYGHEYSVENTRHYTYKSGRTCRFCRKCEANRTMSRRSGALNIAA